MSENSYTPPRLVELPRCSLTLVDGTQPMAWEKTEAETALAHAAFVCFLHLGPSRTLREAYAEFAKGESSRTKPEKKRSLNKNGFPSSWGDWSSIHSWRERAQSFDDYSDRLKLVRRLDAQNELIEAYRLRVLNLGLATSSTAARLLRLVNSKLDMMEKRDTEALALQSAREDAETAAILAGKPVPDWRGQKQVSFTPLADYKNVSTILRNAAIVSEIGQEAEAQGVGIAGFQTLLAEQESRRESMD